MQRHLSPEKVVETLWAVGPVDNLPMGYYRALLSMAATIEALETRVRYLEDSAR